MVGLLTVSSGGLVAEGLSDTVTVVGTVDGEVVISSGGLVAGGLSDGVLGEAVVEGGSVVGDVVVGCVVGAGGHRAARLRLGLFIGRERVCTTPSLAAMSASTILLPPTLMSLPLIVMGIEHLLLQYHLY